MESGQTPSLSAPSRKWTPGPGPTSRARQPRGQAAGTAGVRSTQAGAPEAEPWLALAPLWPPHPRQEKAELILLEKEVRSLCASHKQGANGLHPPAQRPASDQPLSSEVCLPFPATGVPSAHKQASRALKPKLKASHLSVPFTASLEEGAVTARPHFLVPHASPLGPSCLLLSLGLLWSHPSMTSNVQWSSFRPHLSRADTADTILLPSWLQTHLLASLFLPWTLS